METYFAIAERETEEQVRAEVDFIAHSPVLQALLTTLSGVLAVVNERRQILAINTSFFQLLDIQNPEDVLGLRPGEVLRCVHAHEMEGGCGTSKYCATCGAAVAMVARLDSGRPQERRCVATVIRQNDQHELLFSIQVTPFIIHDQRFLLLFLQDILIPQQWAALEQTFFHDITNLIYGLRSNIQLLNAEGKTRHRDLTEQIEHLAARLSDEVAIQQMLLRNHDFTLQPVFEKISIETLLQEIQSFYYQHPVAANKRLTILPLGLSLSLKTHVSLLLRVLCNMLTNAFEATPDGGEVRLWIERNNDRIIFRVWNILPIAPEIQLRLFQKNFSTKDALGHGLGTYAMKLIGEQLLHGSVSFTSSEDQGTCFSYSYPLA